MVRFGRLLFVAVLLALGGGASVAAVGAALPAGAADQCLPPPQVLLSEVARVAGTGSKLWGDIQGVEQADAAAGTSGPGQVLQDMLNAATSDGYQWDCAGSQLIPPANAPPRSDLPPDGTRAPGSGATVGGNPATGGGTTVAGSPAHDSAGGSPAGNPTRTNLLAAPAASNSGGGSGLPSYVLAALAVVSGLLIVFVVRRQMGRR